MFNDLNSALADDMMDGWTHWLRARYGDEMAEASVESLHGILVGLITGVLSTPPEGRVALRDWNPDTLRMLRCLENKGWPVDSALFRLLDQSVLARGAIYDQVLARWVVATGERFPAKVGDYVTFSNAATDYAVVGSEVIHVDPRHAVGYAQLGEGTLAVKIFTSDVV